MRVLRWILVVLAVLVAALALLVLGARFRDGPLGPLAGGPLRSGELAAAPPADWAFARDVPEIELQLETQGISRTTWILVRDGAAFVPCSLDFPPFKTWYRRAAEDGRAIVRVEGKRYPVTLVKVDDAATEAALRAIAGTKYATGPRPPEGRVWFFRIAPRS